MVLIDSKYDYTSNMSVVIVRCEACLKYSKFDIPKIITHPVTKEKTHCRFVGCKGCNVGAVINLELDRMIGISAPNEKKVIIYCYDSNVGWVYLETQTRIKS